MNDGGSWDVIFVLANLAPNPQVWTEKHGVSTDLFELGASLGSPNLELAPPTDSRVQEAIVANPNIRRLIDSFVDSTGKQLSPTLLITRVREGHQWDLEALVAFRNAIAMSVVLRNRASWLTSGDMEIGYSDYFDFHPLRLNLQGLVSASPAQTEIISRTAKYLAMPSPYAATTSARRLWLDGFVYTALSVEWRQYYEEHKSKSLYGRALFRSLEIAYVASSAPNKHGGSIYEWGVQIALWVSALECLISGLGVRSSKATVLDLLGEYEWNEYRPSLGTRSRTIRMGESERRVNLVEDACHLLYLARNRFLHGNEVGLDALFPWGNEPREDGEPAASLIAIAPIVYRTALHAYLSHHHKPQFDDTDWTAAIDPLLLMSVMGEQAYGEALQQAYRIDDDPLPEDEE